MPNILSILPSKTMKAIRTTHKVEWLSEPCYKEVLDDDPTTFVRFAPLYFYDGTTKVIAKEYLGGEFNSAEDLDMEWGDMDDPRPENQTANSAPAITDKHLRSQLKHTNSTQYDPVGCVRMALFNITEIIEL